MLKKEDLLSIKGGGAALETAIFITSLFVFVLGIVRGYKRCK